MAKKHKQLKDQTVLTKRHSLFVKEYMKDLNGKQAAIRAGYAPACADAQAAQILSLPKVRKAVDQEMERRAKKLDITAQMVLKELWEEYKRLQTASDRYFPILKDAE